MKETVMHPASTVRNRVNMSRPNLTEVAMRWSAPNLPDGLFGKRGTDKLRGHSYIQHYEKLMGSKREEDVNLLEIGVAFGGSLGMWKDYFGNGKIYGLDKYEYYKNSLTLVLPVFPFTTPIDLLKYPFIDEAGDYLFVPVFVHNSYYEETRVSIDVFDSVVKEKVDESYQDDFFDFIIDDGSHEIRDQVQTFCNFYPKLKENGLYVVEDIEVHYVDEFENIFKDIPNFTLKRNSSDHGFAYFYKTKEFDYEGFFKKNYDPELLASDPSGCEGVGNPENSLNIHCAYCLIEPDPRATLGEFYADISPRVSYFEERPYHYCINCGDKFAKYKAKDPKLVEKISDELVRVHEFYCDMRGIKCYFDQLAGAI